MRIITVLELHCEQAYENSIKVRQLAANLEHDREREWCLGYTAFTRSSDQSYCINARTHVISIHVYIIATSVRDFEYPQL